MNRIALATNDAGTRTSGRIDRAARTFAATRRMENTEVAMSIAGSAVKSSEVRNSASRVALPLTNWALTAAAQSMAVIIGRGMRVICATLPFVNGDYLPKLTVAGDNVSRRNVVRPFSMRVSKCNASYPSARTST